MFGPVQTDRRTDKQQVLYVCMLAIWSKNWMQTSSRSFAVFLLTRWWSQSSRRRCGCSLEQKSFHGPITVIDAHKTPLRFHYFAPRTQLRIQISTILEQMPSSKVVNPYCLHDVFSLTYNLIIFNVMLLNKLWQQLGLSDLFIWPICYAKRCVGVCMPAFNFNDSHWSVTRAAA